MAPQERDTGRRQGRASLLAPQSQPALEAALTPTRRRLQQRKSHSPYPKGSPRTPVRRLVGESSKTALASRSQPTSPQSPGMRALSSILGFLSPFAASRQAKGSAAFGEPEEDTTADDEHVPESQLNTISIEEDDTTREAAEDEEGDGDEDEEMDTQESIYPPLPDKIASIETARRPREGTPPFNEHTTMLKSPRQSIFTSQSLSLPRHSTPSKNISGASAFSPSRRQGFPPSAPSFTFGRQYADNTSSPALPIYPRTTAKTSAQNQATSPLAKNYDLLARFFAEKAEQEARGHGGDSAISLPSGEVEGEEGEMGLTEIEVAGCLKLIEESLAQGRAKELDRLRGDALDRVNLLSVNPAADHSQYSRGAMSRSPSLPLGATAGEMSGTYGLQSRPSSSFLSPAYPRSDDAQINRSLASAFSTNSAPLKRRHRPLYLGPGQGASAASALMRRNRHMQQVRRGQMNRGNPTQRSSGAPSWQQDEADPEDRDASGNRVKRRRMLDRGNETGKKKEDADEDEEMTAAEPQPRSLSASQSLPSFAFHASPVKDTVSPRKPTTSTAPPVQASSPARTATADAMLSILSAGPSIPIRRAAPKPSQSGMEGQKEEATLVPEIINPYQTRSRLTKRSSLAPSSNSLAAKEKERLKEERERKQKSIEEAKKRKESTLEMIERTAPGRRAASTRRSRAIDEADGVSKKKREEGDEEQHQNKKKQTEAARSKEEEEKKERDKKADEAQEEQQRKKAALGAEQRRKQTEEVRKRMDRLAEKQPPSSPSSTSAEEPTSPATAPVATSNGPRKSFTFGSTFAPKKPSPLSQADNMAPESPSSVSEKSERDGGKGGKEAAKSAPFPGFFSSPSSNAAPASPTPATGEKPPAKDPRQEAQSIASSLLPKFDFTASVLSSAPVGVKDEASRLAREKAVDQLPTFEIFTASKTNPTLPVATIDTPKAAETVKPAAPATPFSFAPSTAASSIGSTPFTSTPASAAASDTEADSGSDAKASDGAASALLSGSGEGEEDEDCLHEVRSKVWSLKEGKWIDLGIGLFKIKKNKSTGKKRILMRNEGNGKVMVNFHLSSSFKPIKDKNVVSFLGFDASGKPTNYRCKVKTGEMADELETALQREAAA